ncbi:carbohydrate ABC transporter permease [Mesorhizobium sp. INR15]|uniref:carbohydrate ABC transporter permease n=1 Tax=Mesorhizobium sp. INR15 TaxID=2654248 RepID=UPI0018966147|nr:carbohydrate ABC transporter permease [Mesorhizobium sp. INR15]QPC91790.1 ABC transporter permease subunit [Mesorhizobium sp. INR15]
MRASLMAASPKKLLAYLILGAWSGLSVFLVVWVIMASLKNTRGLFGQPWSLPTSPVFENYVKAWVSNRFEHYFLNSFLVVSCSVVALLLVAVPAAYVLSRGQFKGRKTLLNFFIFGMGVPIPLLFIPLVVLTTELGIVDTLVGLGIVYVSIALPFTIYVLQGFFSSLPSELESAAIIDGCSDWQVFWHVMLPLAAPGAATVAILNFVALWNEYQISLVLINSPENRTLSLGIYSLITSMQYSGGNWPGLFAGVTIVMVPTVALYIFLSERMISGITMGGVK